MRAGRAERNAQNEKKSSTPKVLLILILLLVIVIAGAVFYMYKNTEKSLSLSFTENDLSIEFGEERSAMDLVADSDGDVSPSSELLDTSSLGDSELVYTVSKPVLGGLLRPSKEFTLSYNVIDSVPPMKLWSGNGVVLQKGEEFSIENVIGYGDNADPEPSVEYDGEIDMDEAGEYPLHVRVSDASGNVTEWDLTVSVVEELPSYESDYEGTKFSDFMKEYAGEGRTFGIDVSSWQDDIDFEAVKKAGCEFVIIRIGFTSGDESVATMDLKFSDNLRKAKAAGLKTGIYLYSDDSSEDRVRASADWVVRQLNGEKLDLPVAFDWEDFGRFQTYKISFAELNSLYDAFSDEMSKSGYDCMLYSSRLFLDGVWEDTDKKPVWLAHYTEKTDYEGPYMIWQASCTGRIDGIKGAVDMDIMYE